MDSFAYELSHDSLALAVFQARRSKVKLKWLLWTALAVVLLAGVAYWQWRQSQHIGQIANANLAEYKQQVAKLVTLDREGARTIKEPKMVNLPSGSFNMGRESGNSDEMPVHQVKLSAFALSAYEVTFEAYDQFAASTSGHELPDDNGWGRGKRPVINVSWDDATAYAVWLSEKTGKRYRLPTEAEWEYATRAGTASEFSWGKGHAGDYAWFADNAGGQTHPVGEKQPNAFGLYDMVGNAWEWVQDCYAENYDHAPVDGSAWLPKDCPRRVLRGGSWGNLRGGLRSGYRYRYTPGTRNYYLGFRLTQD